MNWYVGCEFFYYLYNLFFIVIIDKLESIFLIKSFSNFIVYFHVYSNKYLDYIIYVNQSYI